MKTKANTELLHLKLPWYPRQNIFDENSGGRAELIQTKIKIYLLTLLCFISFQPWITWKFYAIIAFSLAISYIILASFSFKLRYLKSLLIIYIVIYFLFLKPLDNLNAWIAQAFSIIFIFIFLNESYRIKKLVFIEICSVIAYIYLIGIPIYLILSVINIPSPFGTIEGRSISASEFANYIFYIKYVYSEPGILIRFNSIFDEPGVVGNISFFLLFFNKFKLNNWKFVVILIGGMLSFSLFFYIASIICFVLLHLKNLYKIFLVSVLILICGNWLKENEYINNYLFDRIKFQDGNLSGDNRTTIEWDKQYSEYLKSGNKYFGIIESAKSENEFENIATYQVLIYKYGFFGFSIFLIFFMIAFYKKTNKSISFIVFIAFLMAIYQRPWIFEYYYSIIFLSGIIQLRITELLNRKSTLVYDKKIKFSRKWCGIYPKGIKERINNKFI